MRLPCKKCSGEGRIYKSKYGGNDPDVWDAGQCEDCEGKGTTGIEAGVVYVNGRGDVLGPMDERTPGVFLDQHGAVYRPDGRQWDHAEGSTANLVSETAAEPDERTALR